MLWSWWRRWPPCWSNSSHRISIATLLLRITPGCWWCKSRWRWAGICQDSHRYHQWWLLYTCGGCTLYSSFSHSCDLDDERGGSRHQGARGRVGSSSRRRQRRPAIRIMIVVIVRMTMTCGQRAEGEQLNPWGQSAITGGADDADKGHERPGVEGDDVGGVAGGGWQEKRKEVRRKWWLLISDSWWGQLTEIDLGSLWLPKGMSFRRMRGGGSSNLAAGGFPEDHTRGFHRPWVKTVLCPLIFRPFCAPSISHTDVHSLDSSSLLNAHCLHCLSVFAISPRSLSWLSSCIAFIAKSFVAFAATWPVSNHPSLLWDFSIMNDLFPSPPIHIIVAFYILCSTSRSTLLPMLITSRCWWSLLKITPSASFLRWLAPMLSFSPLVLWLFLWARFPCFLLPSAFFLPSCFVLVHLQSPIIFSHQLVFAPFPRAEFGTFFALLPGKGAEFDFPLGQKQRAEVSFYPRPSNMFLSSLPTIIH